MNKIHVAVLCGGTSSEREISLRSGRNIAATLPSDRYETRLIEIAEDGRWLIEQPCDVVFVALHGTFGEDGRVQAALDMLNLPYTGSGVLASALGMDKAMAQKLLAHEGIASPAFIELHQGNVEFGDLDKRIASSFGYPCVIKPNASGSSIGVSIIDGAEALEAAVTKAFIEDSRVLVQRYIQGREVTCGIIGNNGDELMALPPVEIISPHRFFDYEAKYADTGTREICPAELTEDQTRHVRELAKRVHEILGCDGLTRADFLMDSQGEFWFLEINTIPGLTEQSLCPKEARAAGMTFGDLVSRLVELALKKNPRS